jgi:hypothetical protein
MTPAHFALPSASYRLNVFDPRLTMRSKPLHMLFTFANITPVKLRHDFLRTNLALHQRCSNSRCTFLPPNTPCTIE